MTRIIENRSYHRTQGNAANDSLKLKVRQTEL